MNLDPPEASPGVPRLLSDATRRSPASRAGSDGAGLVLALTLALAPGAAGAQNPAQIARVQAGSACRGCNLFQGAFSNLNLRRRDLTGARLRQAELTAADLKGARLARADLRDVDAYGAVFTGADLRGADLRNASLVGAYLSGADLAGARLAGANLSGAELLGARGLSPGSLEGACGDASTRLPPRLSLPPCR